MVGSQNNCGIGACVKLVSVTRKLCFEFYVVVNLAIENDPQAAIRAGHWLMAGGREVQDRQTPKSEGEIKRLTEILLNGGKSQSRRRVHSCAGLESPAFSVDQ